MRNVVVTGGSRGLGLGIAQRLAADGFRVIAVARNESEALCDAIVNTVSSMLLSTQFQDALSGR